MYIRERERERERERGNRGRPITHSLTRSSFFSLLCLSVDDDGVSASFGLTLAIDKSEK